MNDAFQISGVGLSAQQRALDIIANNIANMNTPAFKRADPSFSEVVASVNAGGRTTESRGFGVSVRGVNSLERPGEIVASNNPLDVAIDGAGFVEVLGPEGQSQLWRGGSLVLQADGALGVRGGGALRAHLVAPRETTGLQIAPDGAVIALTSSGERVPLGRIPLVRVEGDQELTRLSTGLYELGLNSQLVEMVPGEEGMGSLVQGAVERSNVDLNDEMVQLLIVQRAYAANAQVVQAADQLMGIVNTLRR